MKIGLGLSMGDVSSVRETVPQPNMLSTPENLYTASQSAFDTEDHINFRSNWQITDGRLTALSNNTNDVRLDVDQPLKQGNAAFLMCDLALQSGNLKLNLGGDGAVNGRNLNANWQGFQYYPSDQVKGNYTRAQIKPSASFSGSIDDVKLYDLSTVDPNQVACDVILIGGDSNSANATSEFVDTNNRETAFDPRIWYIPCLRASSTFGNTGSLRHIPQPMIEPVIASPTASRMSPCHAAAERLVARSAARGRPLLVLALGDPGSGLMNTEDWRKSSTIQNTGSRMWNEMISMKAALEALGPAHEIVGMIWSMGANDRFSGSDADAFDRNHLDAYTRFFADVRADIANVPMVLLNIGQHIVDWFTDEVDSPGFGPAMQEWLDRFDQDSGHPNALTDFKVVHPPIGNSLLSLPNNDPHFNAVGMQANGRVAGDALLSLLDG